jgi:hypothetical protein
MKTTFLPDDFLSMLETTAKTLLVLVTSSNYQEIVSQENCGVDFTLVDAIQAVEQASDVYSLMHQSDLAEE